MHLPNEWNATFRRSDRSFASLSYTIYQQRPGGSDTDRGREAGLKHDSFPPNRQCPSASAVPPASRSLSIDGNTLAGSQRQGQRQRRGVERGPKDAAVSCKLDLSGVPSGMSGSGLGIRCSKPLNHATTTPISPHGLPYVKQRLVRTIVLRRIPASQSVAVHRHDAARHPAIINPRLVVAIGEERRRRAICLSLILYRSLTRSFLTEPRSDRAPHIDGPAPDMFGKMFTILPSHVSRVKNLTGSM
jgi:hypothetical protein